MRIIRNDSLALLVDVQEKLFPHIAERETLEKNIITLIKGLQILKIQTITTEQYRKGLGRTIGSIADILADKRTLEKTCFSCFDDPLIAQQLNSSNSTIHIIAGIEAHVCILQTCIDSLNSGAKVVVVEDCISSRKLNDKKVAVERMRQEGAIITTYESLLLELTRYSGTDEFKAISALIK